MILGGPPADAGTPAEWLTNQIAVRRGGSSVLVRQSALLTISSFGGMDSTGGSCAAYAPGSNIQNPGNIGGGSCSQDSGLTVSIESLFGGWRLAAR